MGTENILRLVDYLKAWRDMQRIRKYLEKKKLKTNGGHKGYSGLTQRGIKKSEVEAWQSRKHSSVLLEYYSFLLISFK